MRKVNPDAKKAMKLMYSEKISLGEAWKRVKSEKSGSRKKSMKRSKRRLSRAKNSLKLNRKKMQKKSRRSRRRSLKFGSSGPGYDGQTSYPSASASYFGKLEPYVNPSEWFLPVTNGQVQSPQMLYKS